MKNKRQKEDKKHFEGLLFKEIKINGKLCSEDAWCKFKRKYIICWKNIHTEAPETSSQTFSIGTKFGTNLGKIQRTKAGEL